MTTDRLIWAVVALTSAVMICITLLAIFRPGDNTGVIAAILGVAGPTISVLIVLLQGQGTQKKVDEVKQEAQVASAVAVAVNQQTERAAQKAEETALKVDEIRETVVNGRQAQMQRRIDELESHLRQQKK